MTYRVELLPDRFELDYHQMGDTFKLLADIRFKLLALVPAVAGVATAVTGNNGTPAKTQVALGLLGSAATLGILLYELRNSGSTTGRSIARSISNGSWDSRVPRSARLRAASSASAAQLQTRLEELSPLVREYKRLQHAEAALADASPTSGKRAGPAKRAGSRAGGAVAGGVVLGRVRAGARARRPSVRATARRFWRSSVSDRASRRPSSGTPRGSRAPASPRICAGCWTAARFARKRCRARRPATGS